MYRRLAGCLCAAALLTTTIACGNHGASAARGTATSPFTRATTTKPPVGNAHLNTTYHGDNRRTGDYAGVTTPTGLWVDWTVRLDGSVYAQPLVVGGTVLVATENDTMYSLDAATGAVRWRTHVGTPQQASALPCGNISPTVGITGTPVYDPATGWVYAVAEESGPKHELVALDAATGAVELRQNVDLGTPGTAPDAMQQRAALLDANGRVYVAFGGRDGDCGAYRGQLIGVPLRGGTPVSYTVPTSREAGAWAASGPAADADGTVYLAVGNGAAGEDPGQRNAPYDHSDAILKLSPTLQLLGFFAPADWRTQNASDLDLGSTGPTLLDNGLVLAVGKGPDVYVTKQADLGGIGGELTKTSVCRAFGGTAQSGTTVYLPCTDGVRAVTVGADGAIDVVWHAAGGIAGSPVVGGSAVWALDQSSATLHALSVVTGKDLASVRLAASVSRFATPALAGAQAFVGTMDGVTAVAIS